MKIIIGVLIIIFCTLIGYYLSLKYSKRKNYYGNFCNFNKIFKTEVAFSQKTLKEIINGLNTEKNDFLQNLIIFLEKNNASINKVGYLTHDENNFMLEYFNNIGNTEKNVQLEFLKKSEELLNENYKDAIDKEKKYKSLFIKLGFLIGLIIFILLL